MGLITAKTVGAEMAGGCKQFPRTYSITKVLKKDKVTSVSASLVSKIISISSTGDLTIKDYSGVETVYLDEA